MSLEAEITQRLADEAAAGRDFAHFHGHHQRVAGLYAARLDRGAVRASPVHLQVYAAAGATFMTVGQGGNQCGYRGTGGGGPFGSIAPETFTIASTQYTIENLFFDNTDRLVIRMGTGAQVAGWTTLRATLRGIGVATIPWTGSQYAGAGAISGGYNALCASPPLWITLEDGS